MEGESWGTMDSAEMELKKLLLHITLMCATGNHKAALSASMGLAHLLTILTTVPRAMESACEGHRSPEDATKAIGELVDDIATKYRTDTKIMAIESFKKSYENYMKNKTGDEALEEMKGDKDDGAKFDGSKIPMPDIGKMVN